MSYLPYDNFYKDGFNISLENAKRLAKIAECSANQMEFGIACSLNILAGEEAIKAIALIIKHYHLDLDLNDFDKLFTHHKIKHNLLIEASNIITPIVDIVYTEHGFYNYLFDMIHRLSSEIPEPDRSKFMNGTKPFLDFLKENIKADNDKIKLKDAKAWWERANLEKNRGLYVDLINSNWHDPKSFTKEKYEDSSKYTNSMIRNADRMIDLLERSEIANEK